MKVILESHQPSSSRSLAKVWPHSIPATHPPHRLCRRIADAAPHLRTILPAHADSAVPDSLSCVRLHVVCGIHPLPLRAFAPPLPAPFPVAGLLVKPKLLYSMYADVCGRMLASAAAARAGVEASPVRSSLRARMETDALSLLLPEVEESLKAAKEKTGDMRCVA
jgi:hypothetical protein